MPVVFTNPQFPLQVGSNPANKAFSVQSNLREMIGEVTQWNPDVDPNVAARWLNNHYRKILNKNPNWYGCKVRGQITVPTVTQTGQVNCIAGNPTVTGVGTAWTPSLVGLQFRTGFTFSYQTIVAVNQGLQTLQLDMPFGGATGLSGYQIVQAYITLGANIKRLNWAVNQLQGWPMDVKTPVESLNAWDTWRTNLGWSTNMATRPPTPDGQFQVEIWPTPYGAQEFPFEAWTQPPNMVADTDAPVTWISSEIIVERAIADALLFRGKSSKYYDPTAAAAKIKEFSESLDEAILANNGLDQQDVTWDYGMETGSAVPGAGSTWAQNHD